MPTHLQMPANIDAERALLGSIIIDNTLMVDCINDIVAGDFYESKNSIIYSAYLLLYKEDKKIDFTSIKETLTNQNKFDMIGLDYINKILDITYTTSNVKTYIELIRESSIKRQAISTLQDLAQYGFQPNNNTNDYLLEIEKKIFDLSKRRKTENFAEIGSVVDLYRERTLLNANSDGSITGIDTGFSNLNAVTLGLQPKTLVILAARPAMGKSAMAMNMAVNIAKKDKKDGTKPVVAVFSLEMGAEQLVERMIASEARIDLNALKTGNLTPAQRRLYDAACLSLSKLNIYFEDSSSVTINDIRSKCRKLAAEKGLDFVVIDYLQLIEGDGSTHSKQEEVSKISRNLKIMARELEIPVVALAQLSREVEKRESKIPIMADLRDSGSIEQDADIVMFLYRDEYYNKNTERVGEADMIIAKNRSGSSGTALRYNFLGQFSNFTEIKE